MFEEIKRILVGIDGSYNSNRAFNRALKIAEKNGAELYVTRVVEDYSIVEEDGILQLVSYDEDPEVIEARDDLNSKFMLTRYPITDTLLRIGNPRIIIKKYLIPGLKIDLLVLGFTGKDIPDGKHLGSLTKYLTGQVKCRVLVVD